MVYLEMQMLTIINITPVVFKKQVNELENLELQKENTVKPVIHQVNDIGFADI